MNLLLSRSEIISGKKIKISGSKSETNRLLLLRALYPNITLHNISSSDDSIVMEKALNNKDYYIDIYHAGTAMRFLTAYFASKEGSDITLTGSKRMQERPIHLLVNALVELGTEINYKNTEGYPPLKIKGKKLSGNKISISGNISSQYLSALLLIAPSLPNGLELKILNELTSKSYLEMTIELLRRIGIKVFWKKDTIVVVNKRKISPISINIESDWSSASYYYSFIALSTVGTEITLSILKKETLQGDAYISELYIAFGVITTFNSDESITLKKVESEIKNNLKFNLNSCPDIAQTVVITSLGLQVPILLEGLQTLKIKETDRLIALKTEIEKLGSEIAITDQTLQLYPKPILSNVKIETYQDHRMAMAFAPLSIKTNIVICDAEVVSKSYPDFWKDIEKTGIQISKIEN